MAQTKRRKVFISYHVDDQEYKDLFAQMMENDIVDKSVKDDDIDDTNLKADRIRQIIRDDYIADATVTVVLIGPCTWQRKHVDWEIGSSLRDTKKNSRCGLLGILLPNHPDSYPRTGKYNPRLIPPKLADNCNGNDSFACIHYWPEPWDANVVQNWIHRAFQRRDKTPDPNNKRGQFAKNRSGDCSAGWKD